MATAPGEGTLVRAPEGSELWFLVFVLRTAVDVQTWGWLFLFAIPGLWDLPRVDPRALLLRGLSLCRFYNLGLRWFGVSLRLWIFSDKKHTGGVGSSASGLGGSSIIKISS